MSELAKAAAVAALVSLAPFGAVPVVSARVPQGVTADAPRQALEDSDARLAESVERAGAAEGFWPFLADDALFLEPGLDVVRGRDAIRSALAAKRDRAMARMMLHRVASGQSEDAAIGYTFGWIEQASGDGAPEYPRYLAAWRAVDGRWRLHAFARSSGRARPSPAPAGNPVVAGYHGFASPGDPARLASDLARTDRAFAALAAGQTKCAAFVAYADPHAVTFGSADFRWGIDAVRSAHAGCTPADRATWTPIHSAAAASGDLGCTVGTAVFSAAERTPSAAGYADESHPRDAHLKYLTVWARQPDGSWKWLLDTGSPRPPPGGGVRAPAAPPPGGRAR